MKKDKLKPMRKHKAWFGYICSKCDADFTVKENACKLENEIYVIKCPICQSSELSVYFAVRDCKKGLKS